MSGFGPASGSLAGVRVLDLTDEVGAYATKLLADLGADVVCVEPPKGSRTRSIPPFHENVAGPDRSLFHWLMGTNKRSMVVDFDSADGIRVVQDLSRTADVLVTSGAPGRLDRLGLGYDDLARLNPALVYTSISPFGLTGALKDYAADDLSLLAMGGLLYLAGYPGEHPTAVFGYQAYLRSMFAAVGTLIALYSAAAGGEGQLVDVSVQEAVAHALESAAQAYDLEHTVRARVGAGQRDAGLGLFPCGDGLVFLAVGVVGGALDAAWINLADWLSEVPGAEIFAKGRWLDDPSFRGSDEGKALFAEVFTAFAQTRTKAELYAEGQSRGIGICPVATTEDLARDDQLLARDFYVQVEHPELGASFLYPGAPSG